MQIVKQDLQNASLNKTTVSTHLYYDLFLSILLITLYKMHANC